MDRVVILLFKYYVSLSIMFNGKTYVFTIIEIKSHNLYETVSIFHVYDLLKYFIFYSFYILICTLLKYSKLSIFNIENKNIIKWIHQNLFI